MPIIELGAYEWIDDDSKLDSYHFEIFAMSVDGEGFLRSNADPVYEFEYSATDVDGYYTYNLTQPGMFSVEVTVSDRAGNQEKARGLVLFDNSSQVTTTDQPLHCSNGNHGTGKQWLQSTADPLQIRWHGHFENQLHKQQGLLNKVLPWDDMEGIDDTTGNRTTKVINNINGIVKFQIAYEVDDEGGKVVSARGWTDVTPQSESFNLNIPNLDDGESVVVWVKAFDVLNNNKTDRIVIHVDTSRPLIGNSAFNKNEDRSQESPYYFASR